MIPKRAFFYWSGGEPSPLRKLSVTTFRALNPDWQVVELTADPGGKTLLERVHESDIARYRALAEEGGVYFDTDIVFARPIPSHWLNHDLILPLGEDGKFGHIACLGAAPQSGFYKFALGLARKQRTSGKYINYQGYGIHLLERTLSVVGSTDVKWIEHDRFCPIGHYDVARIWNPWTGAFPEMCIGVHWYGGDPLSQHLEPTIDDAWIAESTSLIARASRMAMAPA